MTTKKRTAPPAPPLAGLPLAGGLQPEAAVQLPATPLAVTVNLAPAAAAKLSANGQEKPAAAEGNALPGWQSLGKDHKPTHVNGKQGRREKKVRW